MGIWAHTSCHWSSRTWFGQRPAQRLSYFPLCWNLERHPLANPSALPSAFNCIPLSGLLLQLLVKQPWLWCVFVSGWEGIQRLGREAGRRASGAGVLSPALFCVGRLVAGLLFTSRRATSGPGYKYYVLFLVSHLSGALGAHGKHLFARVCFSSADTRRQAESGQRPATFLLKHCWGLAPVLQSLLLGRISPSPPVPLPVWASPGGTTAPVSHEGATVSPGSMAGIFALGGALIPSFADELWE